MKYKAIIIDDELHCREILAYQVKKYCPDLEIIGATGKVDEAIRIIKEEKPDLLFLDIHMPELNGFELLDVLKTSASNFAIIFTTAFDHFAIKAFRYAAIDYLLKPIRIEELTQSVNRFTDTVRHKEHAEILDVLKNIKNRKEDEKICLPLQEGFQMVEISSILYLSADGSYTNVFFTDGKSLLISKPIAFFEDLLSDDTFLRIHRSYLVNLDMIKSYNSREALVHLTDNTTLIVSKRKRASIQKLFRDFNV